MGITTCCLLSLLLLIPLLCWLLSGTSTSLPYNCDAGFGATTELPWSQAQKDYCCATVGRGCATTALPETKASRHGAVAIITSVASPRNPHAQQILTTARMDSQTGRPGGLWPKRSGAAESMARGAQIRVEGA